MTAQRQRMKVGRFQVTSILLLAGAFAAAKTPGVGAATTERVVIDRYTGLAIGGIDPVAYFTDAKPLRGEAGLEAAAAGAIWRFRNDGNRASFVAHPDLYGPQFGGYDPVDVARGVAYSGNPQVWSIVGERLYLFGDEANRAAFLASPERYLTEAAARWPRLCETLAQ